MYQPVLCGRRLLIAGFVQRLDSTEGKGFRALSLNKIQLIDTKPLALPLRIQRRLERAVVAAFEPCGIFLLCEAEMLNKAGPVFRTLMPFLNAVLYMVKGAQAAEILLLEIQRPTLLSRFFSFQRKLPVVDPFVIGIPCQPPALQTVLTRHQVDF